MTTDTTGASMTPQEREAHVEALRGLLTEGAFGLTREESDAIQAAIAALAASEARIAELRARCEALSSRWDKVAESDADHTWACAHEKCRDELDALLAEPSAPKGSG